MKKIGILLLLSSLTLVLACTKNNEETAKKLLGYWHLQEAMRNDRPSESMEDLYMEFMADGKLRTNLAGTPEEGTYQLKGEKIIQRNTSMNADYVIEEIEDSSMVLTTQLSTASRSYNFRFTFQKVAPGNHPETSKATTQEPLQ